MTKRAVELESYTWAVVAEAIREAWVDAVDIKEEKELEAAFKAITGEAIFEPSDDEEDDGA